MRISDWSSDVCSSDLFAGRSVGLILTGGNIDTRLLANVLLRDLARSGRLARLRIILQDRPGALFHVARIFDQEAVNILELSHHRIFTNQTGRAPACTPATHAPLVCRLPLYHNN